MISVSDCKNYSLILELQQKSSFPVFQPRTNPFIPFSYFVSKKHRYMLGSRYWGSSYKLGVRTEAYWSTRERLRIYQKKVLLQFSAASLYKRYLYNGREVLGKCIPYANHSMRLIHAIYLSNKYSKKVLYCSTK